MTDGGRLRRGIGELPPHEAHMVRFHHDHDLRVHEVDSVYLAAPMPAEVGLGQLRQTRQGRAGAHAHGLAVDGVGSCGHDVQRLTRTPVAQDIEHEPGHDRPRRIARAEHQELRHAAPRSKAGASTSSACCA